MRFSQALLVFFGVFGFTAFTADPVTRATPPLPGQRDEQCSPANARVSKENHNKVLFISCGGFLE